MKYLRVHRTWKVLTSDALGIETYMQKEHTVHSPSMYAKIVWWFFSLSAFSLHYPIFQNSEKWCLLQKSAKINGNSFDKFPTFACWNCLHSSLLEEAVGFWATDGWIPGSWYKILLKEGTSPWKSFGEGWNEEFPYFCHLRSYLYVCFENILM